MKVPIKNIEVGDRKRGLNREKVLELAESMGKLGLLQPIAVVPIEGETHQLIAGLHRLNAAKELGWKEIDVNVLMGMSALEEELGEIDENLIRYELHYTERGDMLARRKEIYEDIHPETKKPKGGRPKKNSEIISPFSDDTASKTGVTQRTVQQEVQIATKLTPEIKEKVREHDIPKTDALKLAREEPKQQKEIMGRIEAGAKNVDSARRQIREESITIPELPTGTYSIILADPPWQYDFSLTDVRKIENQYPTMIIEEISDLNPPAADDCVLFLWTTTAKLEETFTIIRSWGFEYKTSMVWIKDKIGMGYYVRNQHEFILIATKGKPIIPVPENRPPSIINAPRTTHSTKPEILYKLIETMYPDHKYLEMFARNKRPGWDSWGAEI